ncbi:hypothetical protein A3C77_03675 [Candidatus Giovannonibacteria bacterium RIFCSPHIGHO2_02_FULL_45_13]|nr:MAG: hypothetical protein A3C77_03675 [Candidatus Giovannonibacteria bacterium RIFCSPHIGHO2_02_FULL_45_13]
MSKSDFQSPTIKAFTLITLLFAVLWISLYQNSGNIAIKKESCSRFVAQIVQEKITFYDYESPFISKEYLVLWDGSVLSVPIGQGEMDFGCEPIARPLTLLP